MASLGWAVPAVPTGQRPARACQAPPRRPGRRQGFRIAAAAHQPRHGAGVANRLRAYSDSESVRAGFESGPGPACMGPERHGPAGWRAASMVTIRRCPGRPQRRPCLSCAGARAGRDRARLRWSRIVGVTVSGGAAAEARWSGIVGVRGGRAGRPAAPDRAGRGTARADDGRGS